MIKNLDIKVNMIIYDAKHHKIEEIYTHDEVKLDSIKDMMKELDNTAISQRAKRKLLKIDSRDARVSFKFDDKFQ